MFSLNIIYLLNSSDLSERIQVLSLLDKLSPFVSIRGHLYFFSPYFLPFFQNLSDVIQVLSRSNFSVCPFFSGFSYSSDLAVSIHHASKQLQFLFLNIPHQRCCLQLVSDVCIFYFIHSSYYHFFLRYLISAV